MSNNKINPANTTSIANNTALGYAGGWVITKEDMFIEIAAFSNQLHTDLNTVHLALADINERAKKKPDLKVKTVSNQLNNIAKAVKRLEEVASKILFLTHKKHLLNIMLREKKETFRTRPN